MRELMDRVKEKRRKLDTLLQYTRHTEKTLKLFYQQVLAERRALLMHA